MGSDLNKSVIPGTPGYESQVLQDFSESSEAVTVYFRNLEDKLIHHIEESEAVVGAVAWLTNEKILNALSKKELVALVVQKEDFLRPDIAVKPGFSQKLRALYRKLPSFSSKSVFVSRKGILQTMSMDWEENWSAVRCVGNYNKNKGLTSPRMHNKFLVFCKSWTEKEIIGSDLYDELIDNDPKSGKNLFVITPYSVWTGSFNFTVNATRSLENALFISDEKIAQAYYYEWCQIEALSEPLDWEQEWIKPQWKIGLVKNEIIQALTNEVPKVRVRKSKSSLPGLQIMDQLVEEIRRFKEIKAYDTEPLYSSNHERSYPDKDGCEWFESAAAARAFIEENLDKVESGYAVIVSLSGETYASELPNPNPYSETVPEWLDVGSTGFIRLGQQYWEWTDDNAFVWLCPLG